LNKVVTLVNTNQIKPAIAPIAFDYLYDPLVRAGFTVELLDLCFEEDYEAAIASYCNEHSTDFWGVTLRNTDDLYFSNAHSFLSLVQKMVSTLRRYSKAPITMGGTGFSAMPEKILELCDAEFGIVCEGEFSFPLLLTRLTEQASYQDIPGLVYRTPDGFVRNPTTFGDLKQIGVYSRKLINQEKYFQQGGQVGIETKRGCKRVCIYCIEPLVKGRKLRLREPADVVDEMENLLNRGVNVFHINDSEFNLDINHALAFCEEIVKRRLHTRIQWYAYGMPTPFPDHLAEAMCQAGCMGMNFGVDSASERMLRVLRRTFRPFHIARAVETCKRYRLPYMLAVLLGAPGENAETVKETINFFKEIDAESVNFGFGLRIFPGTELERIVREEGFSSDNPNLHGAIEGNEDLVQPVFYLSSHIAPNPIKYVADLIGDDKRFSGVKTSDYNYNANDLLVQAIAEGERGAFWAILSRREKKACGQLENHLLVPSGKQEIKFLP
jgi:radical SAM superfamily enzyme YgiQ (UPF0313 family)